MKKSLLFVLIIPVLAFNVAFADMQVRINKGSSRVVKVNNAQKVEALNESIASAILISEKEIIIEGKNTGTGIIKVKTVMGYETIVVKVRKLKISDKMVEIDVQILEIVNSEDLNVGIDWSILAAGGLPESGLPISTLNLIEANPMNYRVFGADFTKGQMNVLINFLITNNYGKLLAKPKLITSNGKKAQFLAGGEVPVVLVSSLGQSTVEWKEYGVGLEVKPVITKDNNITASMKAEVSNLDYGNAVNIGGNIMPAMRTRWAETTVTIEPESTIVIAGLIQNEEIKVTEGVPVLSWIPLIGELFKSTNNIKKKTELVIFVTPRIIGADSV